MDHGVVSIASVLSSDGLSFQGQKRKIRFRRSVQFSVLSVLTKFIRQKVKSTLEPVYTDLKTIHFLNSTVKYKHTLKTYMLLLHSYIT